MAMHTLLERKDNEGIYRVFFLSGEHAQGEPDGLYVDIAYFDGTGHNQQVSSYVEGANEVFVAYQGFSPYHRRI